MLEEGRLHLAEPDSKLRVAVVIPARNEAAHLPATLQSLGTQRDQRGQDLDPRTFEVIILANNCTDQTATLARQFARDAASTMFVHVVERTFDQTEAHVGTARKWLMDLACQRLESVGQPASLIVSTDADTRVRPDWVAANQAEIESGADAVAGIIDVDSGELRRLGPEIRRAYWLDRVYRRLKLELEAIVDPNPLDPPPCHDWHGGASFAITPAMYRRVGGLPPRPSQEDVALARALWWVDARFVHSLGVRVVTSTRLMGRTSGGHSEALTRWGIDREDQVPDGQTVLTELQARHRLRCFFRSKTDLDPELWRPDRAKLRFLANSLELESAQVADIMVQSETFGEWLELLNTAHNQASTRPPTRLVSISEAILDLRHRIRSCKQY